MIDKDSFYDQGLYRQYNQRKIDQRTLRSLSGLLQGVCIDGTVNQSEIKEVKSWLKNNEAIFKWRPFDLIKQHLDLIFDDDKVDEEELQDILWLVEKLSNWCDAEDMMKEVMQTLHGVFHGILSDKQLSDDELESLKTWVFDNEFLKGTYPYDEISALLVEAFKDGVVTQDERNLIMTFMGEFIDYTKSNNLSKERFEELKQKYSIGAICSVDPDIEFEGKLFCLTGEFSHGSRADVRATIEKLGGTVLDGLTKKVDYLAVGGAGNECWAYSMYGRKVEKAVENRKKGCKVVIVSERDLYDAM